MPRLGLATVLVLSGYILVIDIDFVSYLGTTREYLLRFLMHVGASLRPVYYSLFSAARRGSLVLLLEYL